MIVDTFKTDRCSLDTEWQRVRGSRLDRDRYGHKPSDLYLGQPSNYSETIVSAMVVEKVFEMTVL